MRQVRVPARDGVRDHFLPQGPIRFMLNGGRAGTWLGAFAAIMQPEHAPHNPELGHGQTADACEDHTNSSIR